MPRTCSQCGKNIALVGTRHNCTPIANSPTSVANKPEFVANEIYARYSDKEKRRTYMREYMRKRRNVP
jgi:hypothetical protein